MALTDLSTPSTVPNMEPRTSTGTPPSTSLGWRRAATTHRVRTWVAGHHLPASTRVPRKDVIQRLRTICPRPTETTWSCSRRRPLGRYYWRRTATSGLRRASGLHMEEKNGQSGWRVRSSSAQGASNHLNSSNCLGLATQTSSKLPGSTSKSTTQTWARICKNTCVGPPAVPPNDLQPHIP